MLYYLFYEVLQRYFHALNVFRYITVRTALASLTALLIALVLGPWLIERLRAMQELSFAFFGERNNATEVRRQF